MVSGRVGAIVWNVTPDEVLRLVWIPLGVTVAGGLILAAILAIFVKPVRDKFWKPIGRGFRWLFSLRLTTTKRIALREAEYQRLRDEAGFALSDSARRTITAELVAFNRGRAEALAEVEAQRAEPLIEPVWRVMQTEPGYYVLHNMQNNASVSSISIAAPAHDFLFTSDTQWTGPLVNNVQNFRGERRRRGEALGVRFTIRWRDANGDWRVGEAFIDKEPRRATVL